MSLMQRYPAVSYLKARARRRIPFVAWEFLDSGTGDDRCKARNEAALERLHFVPRYMKGQFEPTIATELFGVKYGAPFGIAPIGQSGFIWPGAEKILAKTAADFSIPYCLSTVAAQSIETIGPLTKGMGWFQLYPPRDLGIMEDLLDRAAKVGFTACMVTADVPVPSRRERQFRAGLTLPPRLSAQVAWQVARRPRWCLEVLRAGGPGFRSLETYAAQMDISGDGGTIVSEFIRRHMGGVLDWNYLARVREIWAGPLILKGVLSGEDAARAVELGVDGLLVSNHGGRQLDAAPASIEMLPEIAEIVQDRARLLFDSGVRTGEDILKAIALGADFVFVGRGFQYGVAALGPRGGDHVAAILIDEMKNVMAQIGAATLGELSPEWIHDAYAGA